MFDPWSCFLYNFISVTGDQTSKGSYNVKCTPLWQLLGLFGLTAHQIGLDWTKHVNMLLIHQKQSSWTKDKKQEVICTVIRPLSLVISALPILGTSRYHSPWNKSACFAQFCKRQNEYFPISKFAVKWRLIVVWCSVWADWAIFCTLANFLKPLATINMPKVFTFLGNFCKGVKIYYFSSEIILGQLL